jgi:hypothetical protein
MLTWYDEQEHLKLLVSAAQLVGMSSTVSIGHHVLNSGPLTA